MQNSGASGGGFQAAPLAAMPDMLMTALKHLRAADAQAQGLQVEPSAAQKMDADWKRVVRVLKLLQPRLAGVSAVQAFAISRDETEVSAKIQSSTRRALLILSRRHPADRAAPEDRVWLSNVGSGETGYEDAGAAMTEFVRRIAGLLG